MNMGEFIRILNAWGVENKNMGGRVVAEECRNIKFKKISTPWEGEKKNMGESIRILNAWECRRRTWGIHKGL